MERTDDGSAVTAEALALARRYDLLMKVVAIHELYARLTEVLEAVRAGETVLITEGDAVVAELKPPGPGRARSVEDAVMLEDIRRGLVTPATRRGAPKLAPGPKFPIETLLRDLREDRDAR